jgi:hypothetical protein
MPGRPEPDTRRQTGVWVGIGVVLFLAFGVYAFISITGTGTRFLSRRLDRRAADMYDGYADAPRRQRRYARRHDDTWRDRE